MMNATEILALIQSARSLLDLGLSQYRLAQQRGRLTEEQKAAILAVAKLTDDQVDAAVESAQHRMTTQSSIDS